MFAKFTTVSPAAAERRDHAVGHTFVTARLACAYGPNSPGTNTQIVMNAYRNIDQSETGDTPRSRTALIESRCPVF